MMGLPTRWTWVTGGGTCAALPIEADADGCAADGCAAELAVGAWLGADVGGTVADCTGGLLFAAAGWLSGSLLARVPSSARAPPPASSAAAATIRSHLLGRWLICRLDKPCIVLAAG